jgi:hypothetical protein
MKIIRKKQQEDAAGALCFVLAVLDRMHRRLNSTEVDLYCDALAECFSIAEAIGGDAIDYLCKHGYEDKIAYLKELGFGRVIIE